MGDSRLRTLYVAALTAGAAALFGCSGGDDSIAPGALISTSSSPLSPLTDTRFFNVRLQIGASATLPPNLQAQVASFTPLFTLTSSTLLALQAAGGPDAPDLTRWYRIVAKPGTNIPTFRAALRALDSMAYVENAPDHQTPPPAATPSFESQQGYLDPATGGMDARFAWTLPGGNGQGITIFDVEYAWNQSHEDLAAAAAAPVLMNAGDSIASLVTGFSYHGTNVLGVLAGSNNGLGVTGMAWGASLALAPEYTTNLAGNRANAILLAVNAGQAGDVILLEMQQEACGGSNFGPAEYEQAVFDATTTAVANGFVVVAAAGNGSVNLDASGCGGRFDRSVRDSGAILVGAGNPPSSASDLQRMTSSSYGARVDVQGWGTGVVTTGPAGGSPGDLYTNVDDPTNPNFWYRSAFDGTSSSSATVAGASAALQGFFKARFGTTLTSFQMRNLLRQTGTPQNTTTAGQIGPRPNLRAAIEGLTQGPIDIMFLVDTTGSYADDLPNFTAQAPTIMAALLAENSDIRFGLASFRDYPIHPFGLSADYAYQLDQQLTTDTGLVQTAIAGLSTYDHAGDDAPESQLTALYQLATGLGQTVGGYTIPNGQGAAFRNDATKLVLLWTDAGFHLPGDPGDVSYPGNSFNQASSALLALDPAQVLGISAGTDGYADLAQIAIDTNSLAPAGGVDCDGDGVTDVPEGDPLVCITDESGSQISQVVQALVGAGLKNRQVDVGIDLSVTSAAPAPMQVGQSVQITLASEVFNDGPSSSATVDWAIQASAGANASVTPTASSASIADLAVGDSETTSRTYTVTCTAAGSATVTFDGSATLVDPTDAFDQMLANNTDRASVSVTCLARVYAANLLDIRNYVTVNGDVFGGNELRYGTDGRITGNAVVNGSAYLFSRARIDGTLTVADVYQAQGGVVVAGGVINGFNGVNLVLPIKSVTTGSLNKTVNNGQTATWTPGNYAQGLVRAGATLNLTAGVYNFTSLTVEPDAHVNLNTSAGPIEVNVLGAVGIGDRTRFVGGNATTAKFYSNSTGVFRLGTDVVFTGSIRAPRGEVHVYSRTTMPANVSADRIVIEPYSSLN